MKKKQPPQLSRVNYIKTKAKSLPIYKCYINSEWMETGMTDVLVIRQHPKGNFTIGTYLIETFDKGLYFSKSFFNQTKEKLDEILEQMVSKYSELNMKVEIDYALAHNIIYGSTAVAKERGHKPENGFNLSKYILEEDDGKIEISFEKSEMLLEKEKELEEEKKNSKA